jgi:hypothetical protein
VQIYPSTVRGGGSWGGSARPGTDASPGFGQGHRNREDRWAHGVKEQGGVAAVSQLHPHLHEAAPARQLGTLPTLPHPPPNATILSCHSAWLLSTLACMPWTSDRRLLLDVRVMWWLGGG